MPEFSEVAFTLTDIVIAALSGGSYGSDVALSYAQTLTIEPQADNDMLKAEGMIVELLSVVTHATFKISSGAVDFAALEALLNLTSSLSGTTPNQVDTLDFLAGGSGLPYFGYLGRFVTTEGGEFIVGGFKAMLDSIPNVGGDQNKFMLPEMAGSMAAQDTTDRRLFRAKKIETATTLPTVADFLA